MKENTESIRGLIYTQFPSSQTKRNQTNLFINILKKQILVFKRQLYNGIATLGIGAVLLTTTYLFFTQLAQYGW